MDITVNSWWCGNTPGTPVSPLNEIVTALINGIPGLSGGKITSTDLSNSGILTPGVKSFLTTRTYTSTKPKAYLNSVLFDE